jgi:hypothetical protein
VRLQSVSSHGFSSGKFHFLIARIPLSHAATISLMISQPLVFGPTQMPDVLPLPQIPIRMIVVPHLLPTTTTTTTMTTTTISPKPVLPPRRPVEPATKRRRSRPKPLRKSRSPRRSRRGRGTVTRTTLTTRMTLLVPYLRKNLFLFQVSKRIARYVANVSL